jgi:hypothetical protein
MVSSPVFSTAIADSNQGAAIGNLGNLLQQLCPHPGFRAAFTGVSYNLGNAISSVAPTIETKLGKFARILKQPMLTTGQGRTSRSKVVFQTMVVRK